MMKGGSQKGGGGGPGGPPPFPADPENYKWENNNCFSESYGELGTV